MDGGGFLGFRKYVLTYQMKLRSEEIMTSQVLILQRHLLHESEATWKE